MDLNCLVKQKKIELVGEGLRDGDLDVLVEVVQKSKVLEELYLSHNQITLSDGKFTNALANNRTLLLLNLYCNNIGPEGAKKLAAALKINKTLLALYVSNNQIGDEGSKSIADALMSDSSLQELDLGSNNIGDEGAKSLAASFLVNQSLHKISLYRNNISDKGAEKLADALQYNCVIEVLYLGRNVSISKKLMDQIKATLDNPNRNSRNLPGSGLNQLMDFVASKEEKIASKDKQIANNHAEIKAKDDEIASLKVTLSSPLKLLEKYIASKDEKIASLEATVKYSKPIVSVDLINEKRPRTE